VAAGACKVAVGQCLSGRWRVPYADNLMNKNIVVKIALIIAFVLALISLITHNDISLIAATVLIAICVILTFAKSKK